MRFIAVTKVIGYILLLFSLSVVIPIAISFYYNDGGTVPFVVTGLLELSLGSIAWFPLRNKKSMIKTRDGFLIVALVWFVLSFFAALPFYMIPSLHFSFTNAFFESISGLTTTGATIITNIDQLPHAVLFYRQELQFLGGMGIVVLAVAILPMLGIGGMQLYRAEIPGPMKENKLTPRITETAKALWLIYLILTVACALSYWLAGMQFFDAIGESFSTVATGGFSMHDASFAYYHSNSIYIVAIIFMFLSGISFALHFTVFQGRNIKAYWRDVEFRYYLCIMLVVIAFTLIVISMHNVYPRFSQDVINTVFTVVAMATTTGFKNSQFNLWPSFIPIMLMCIGMVGACGGSTTGGIKVMRVVLILKQSMREMRRLIHPNGVYSLKFGRHPLPAETIEAMWGFLGVYIATFIFLTLILMATGMNLETAFSAVVDCLSNVGAGIGDVAVTFDHIGILAKWILMITMIAGRLEIFTILLLFTPAFWRK